MNNRNIVKYAITYAVIEVTDAEYDLVHFLYYKNMKVTAIKFIRNQYRLGLKEAKEVCDVIASKYRVEGCKYHDCSEKL